MGTNRQYTVCFFLSEPQNENFFFFFLFSFSLFLLVFVYLQLQAHGRRVEMIGDDTWLDLFPTHFERATPFPSLVVKDIHTVRPLSSDALALFGCHRHSRGTPAGDYGTRETVLS